MTKAVRWETGGPPQSPGWYAQAIRSSRMGHYEIMPTFAHTDDGPEYWKAVAFAGPFDCGLAAFGWARDNMAPFGTARVRSG